MKKSILLLVLSTNILFSQNKEWLTYDLDSLISFEAPDEAFELDTIAQGMRMYQIFSYTGNTTFITQKVFLEKESENEDFSRLPYNMESLLKQYDGIIKGIESSIPHDLISKELIEKESYKGYRLKFENSLNKPVYEVELYLLNKHLYSFFYINLEDFNEEEKTLFFNSVNIDTNKKISQYLGKSQSYRMGYVFGKYFFYILIFGLVIFFTIKKKKN